MSGLRRPLEVPEFDLGCGACHYWDALGDEVTVGIVRMIKAASLVGLPLFVIERALQVLGHFSKFTSIRRSPYVLHSIAFLLLIRSFTNGLVLSTTIVNPALRSSDRSDSLTRTVFGSVLEHGAQVWFADWHGHMGEGVAYYNTNNMWWVVTGKYGLDNAASFDIYAGKPETLRIRRNAQRRKRLEQNFRRPRTP